jgi:hypothetical protein
MRLKEAAGEKPHLQAVDRTLVVSPVERPSRSVFAKIALQKHTIGLTVDGPNCTIRTVAIGRKK